MIIMTKKIKKFGKIIETPEVLAIYNEQQGYFNEVNRLKEQAKEYFRTYYDMEGKYSIGVTSDFCGGQGSRGYNYEYADQEIRAQEYTERETYYIKYIAPLKEQIHELNTKAWALDETLCIALWGFGQEHYRIKRNLEKAEKELAEQIDYVEQLRKQLERLEK